jgi:hypothetical protein
MRQQKLTEQKMQLIVILKTADSDKRMKYFKSMTNFKFLAWFLLTDVDKSDDNYK